MTVLRVVLTLCWPHMRNPAISSAWLSDEMARALAAMCPPLEEKHVVRATETLATDSRSVRAIDGLLRQGLDLIRVRQVIEALRALRDARLPAYDLAEWLLVKEAGAGTDASGLTAAIERVYEKLSTRLSRLVASAAAQSMLSRALYIARADFPFLVGLQAGSSHAVCLEGLAELVSAIRLDDARQGLLAVLRVLLDLLRSIIGEKLTLRLVSEVWPDLPLPTAVA
jgi:hypothetical protein